MAQFEPKFNELGPRPPLAGVRVLALEQAVAAPLCTQHLADLGAEVIKIERPGGGDFARGYDTAVAGESAWFYWLNRGKRSLALDIKSAGAGEVLERLLARSDVFIQNLGPGAADRIGLGGSAIRERYPSMVVCSISGYGSSGPYRNRKAYDALLQGETGVIALTGTEDAPAKTGVSVADIATGMYSLSGILAALYRRASDGDGALIETCLLDSLTEWVAPYLYGYMATGRQPGRLGARHSHIIPYGLYQTDGGEVNIAVQNEREWERFCRTVLKEPELAVDPMYSSNERRIKARAELEPHIEATLKALPHEEAVERLEAADLPWGEYRDIASVVHHPQLGARGRFLQPEREGLPPVLAQPMNIDGLNQRSGHLFAAGEDTDAILAEAGYSAAAIAELHTTGVLGG
jgi:crotonobetainyl-CoA:carnitine CoA-transferase CaiB-like acyl-CoA transferase